MSIDSNQRRSKNDMHLPTALRNFVQSMNGTTPIGSVLIANNGIAAVKEIRSVRKWSYETFGDEKCIKFTVMATPEDLSHNAEYIRMADHFIAVPGGSNNNNYKNVDLIVELAERTGVDAVWAGWGHASEDPRLPDRLADKGIVFIGPPGNAMRALGDKISSTIVAQSANVPTMGWSGDGIKTSHRATTGYIDVPEDLYLQACVTDVEQAITKADQVGYPLMIKASEGGGGKGIRKVSDPSEFRSAYAQVAAEVPGSPIFLMRLASGARHLEVQILADEYGNVISLFGRDCSVQRRHQKIIEEAPVTIADAEVFEQMEMAAVRLAQLVGYVNAGTIEFLYDPASKKYYFLELNPRLQVEHPTTEIVSGVNIPAAQLQVAMGIPLHRIEHIRLLYGLQPHTSTDIDFHFTNPTSHTIQRRPTPTGHVIACRITAENPDAGFKPSGGQLTELNFRSSTDVWGYFSVSANGGLHEYADSQFGHVFAYGHDRPAARRNMIMALKELRIRGDFRTTVEYLITLLETHEFTNNTFTTEWLDGRILAKLTADRPDKWESVISGASIAAHNAALAQQRSFLRSLDKGQVPPFNSIKYNFPVSFILENIQYSINVMLAARDLLLIQLNGSHVVVRARPLPDGGLLVTYGNASHVVYDAEEVSGMRLTVNGKTVVLEQESDPTQLRSPSPGKLVRWLVPNNGKILVGQIFAEIEVMKMIMPLVATDSGTFVGSRKPAGSPIAAGELLATLELDDMSLVKKASICTEVFPLIDAFSGVIDTKAHLQFLELRELLDQAMDGFEQIRSMEMLLSEYIEVLHKPELPYLHTSQVLSSFDGRLPANVSTQLTNLLAPDPVSTPFPYTELHSILMSVPDQSLITPLLATIKFYEHGPDGLTVSELVRLMKRHMESDAPFAISTGNSHSEKAVLELRSRMDPEALYWMCFSRSRQVWKCQCLGDIMKSVSQHRKNLIRAPNSEILFTALHDLAELGSNTAVVSTSSNSKSAPQSVHLRARSLLISLRLPEYTDRQCHVADIIATVTKHGLALTEYAPAHDLLNSPFTIFDVLPTFFFPDTSVPHQLTALDMYVRRAYNTYRVHAVKKYGSLPVPTVEWHFQFSLRNLGIGNAKTPLLGASSRVASVSDMTLMVPRGDMGPIRVGVMAACTDLIELKTNLPTIINLFPKGRNAEPWHVLNLAIQADSFIGNTESEMISDLNLSAMLNEFLTPFMSSLRSHGVRRVTFVIYRTGQYPRYYTFRERLNYDEDATIRHIEPSHAFQLELHRLANFSLLPLATPSNRGVHVYYATGKDNALDSRFFVRALVRPGKLSSRAKYRDTVEYLTSEADSILTDVLNALELAGESHPGTDCNHMFLNFLPELPISPDEVQDSISGFLMRHGQRLWKLRVTSAEIRFLCHVSNSDPGLPPSSFAATYRFFVSNVSGVLKAERYREVSDERSGKVVMHTEFTTVASGKGEYHMAPADHAYPNKELVQPKRYRAHVMGTTYVYDYLDLFREALVRQWAQYPHITRPTESLIDAHELILGEDGQLRKVIRPIGMNSCGMVAWLVTLKTPECPKGRQIVLIANDITYAIGSFGPMEDEVFAAASRYARLLGVPRIYISANSGARIGLAEEVLNTYRIAWVSPSDPSLGFKYLYVIEEEFKRLGDSVTAQRIIDDETGEVHMKLTGVIGLKDGLGVENLMGSALIAGETSLAYDEIFTATLVACRSVGIGAYLVRLGQRVIQCEGQPIILTGAAALNKVLGRDVYTSNLQLGGLQIMHRNGISHLTCVDPLHGVSQLVQWISYVPAAKGAPLPFLHTPLFSSPSINAPGAALLAASVADDQRRKLDEIRDFMFDDLNRDIEFKPTKKPYDPRHMLHGHEDATTGLWVSGFFDRGSWVETMDGWSKTVVVGRGRLGGVPVGAIAVETRTMESVIPADPANPDSSEQTMMEAPGVWTPMSAYKTAQAIQDIAREDLPLIIFANWRGFSGGQRDMYDAVLKFGSHIVDALREYPNPVFVYIVPHGELRGGAWVVLDPNIHQSSGMEMYADTTARGGVLEPEGIVEIKYRKPQLFATMERLDMHCNQWKAKLKHDKDVGIANPPSMLRQDSKAVIENSNELENESTRKMLSTRQEMLYPMYQQAALAFADLHDTPGRMLAKGAIRSIVDWPSCRRFFHWRIRRRVAEMRLMVRIAKSSPTLSRSEQNKYLRTWFCDYMAMQNTKITWDDVSCESDILTAQWLEAADPDRVGDASSSDEGVCIEIQRKLKELETKHLSNVVAQILRENPQAAVSGIAQALLVVGPNAGDSSSSSSALHSFAQIINSMGSTN